jgi:hypothetical protein
LLDAVHHAGKAFWVSVPGKYKLASAVGKSLMVYEFTPEGARSLMENYLICGSGDFAEANEETWVGETSHPNYTIWKTDELGAYGIGPDRLAVLAEQIVSIKAYTKLGGEEIKKGASSSSKVK